MLNIIKIINAVEDGMLSERETSAISVIHIPTIASTHRPLQGSRLSNNTTNTFKYQRKSIEYF